MSEVLIGVDLGSTRTKVGIVTTDGRLLGLARVGHAFDVDPTDGRAEQDPGEWWTGLGSAVGDALAQAAMAQAAMAAPDRTIDPIGICVAGHGPTLVATDADGVPVRPAITWLDSRAGRERDELEAATGLRGWALGVLPAARWLERNEPASAARTRWYLNTWEAMALRLTGRAGATVVPGADVPAAEVLLGAGLAVDRLAPTIDTGSVVGTLSPSAARHLGLRPGIPVVAGLVDAFASFHGARMLEPGDAIDVGGAAGGFGVYWDRPVQIRGGFTTPAPLPDRWSVGAAMAATGAALDWLAGDVLGGADVTALIREADAVPAGAEGLVFLPYLAGERSPLWDPSARGAFAGLTLRHGRAHLVRAVLEAAAFAIRHVAEPMLEAGITVSAMRTCGGPAQSDTWNQLKADITGFTVEVPRVRETATLGAAIVAAVGVGAHGSVPEAIGAMTAIDRRIEPDGGRRVTYDRAYAAYRDLWPAIAPIVRRVEAGVAAIEPTPAGAAA